MSGPEGFSGYTMSTMTNLLVLDTDSEDIELPRPDYEAMPPSIRVQRASTDRQTWRDLFDLTHSMGCLNMAITAGQVAADAADDPEAGTSGSVQADAHIMLAMLLELRTLASQNTNLSHLTAAIEQHERAVERAMDSDSRAICLNNLRGHLLERYDLTGRVDDLRKAEETGRRAVASADKDASYRCTLLHGQGLVLRKLHEVTGDELLLHQALRYSTDAVDLAQDQSRSSLLLYKTERASTLLSLYDSSRNLAHLQAAIRDCETICNESETATVDVDRNSLLGENWLIFSGLLGRRFDELHVRADVDRALQAGANALNTLPRGHPLTASRLANIADQYSKRFEEYGNRYDLDEAVRLADMAYPKAPDDSTFKWKLRVSLARLLATRYRVFKDRADIDRAVELAEEGTKLGDKGDGWEQQLSGWDELASVLHTRATFGPSEAESDQADLERAVELGRRRLGAYSAGSAGTAVPLNNLGINLIALHKMTGSARHLDEGVACLSQCSEIKTAPPIWRINAAKRAIDLLMKGSRLAEADGLLRRAVSLLRQVSPRSLEHKDQQNVIKKFAGLATLAASVALQTGAAAEDALQLLEDGRGIILGLLFEARSDVGVLRSKRADLAAAFERLRDTIDAPEQEGPRHPGEARGVLGPSQALTRREEATAELEKLLAVIRGLDDDELKHFMEPPRMDKLKTAAAGGPIVVVNVSDLRSDAFIIWPDAVMKPIETLPLPGLGLASAKRWEKLVRSGKITQDQMFELLEWLWYSLGSPVLAKLDEGREEKGVHRVWWIPTGPLSSLPVHAAGAYDDRSPPADNMLARAISSYSPFIKAMLWTRGNQLHRGDGDGVGKVLLVSMVKTEGRATLSAARTETDVVQKQLSPLAKLEDDLVSLQEPATSEVLASLPGSSILHFAGHGQSDPADPLRSTLLTRDWRARPLTVRDLLALQLHRDPPLLAYLSACSTGTGGAADLADEGLHLLSACQLAGFQHAVGSLWAVSDRHCVDVARTLYAAMAAARMGDESVSRGLRDAVRRLHSRTKPKPGGSGSGSGGDGGHTRQGAGPVDPGDRLWFGHNPRVWAAYVHIGP